MRAYVSLLALAAVAVGVSSAQADGPRGTLYQTMIEDAPQRDVEMVSYQQFNAMEQRLAAMEKRLSSVETVGYSYDEAAANGANNGNCGCGSGCGCDSGCGGCGNCNDCWCHQSCGWTFSAELLFLRAHDSEASDSGDNFDKATRTSIGCVNECGHEFRVRHFQYSTDLRESDYVELKYVDLEYVSRYTLGCNWRGEIGLGLRWADYDESGDLQYSDALGPELGAVLIGPCCRGWEPFASLRNSWQFGSAFGEDRGTFSVTEVQIGLQCTTCICGGTGFFRTMLEADKWEGVFQDDSQDLGLFGYGVAVGLMR